MMAEESAAVAAGEIPDPHPLQLTPVLRNLMTYLSTRDLMNARLVNKHWNTGACGRLRRTKTIKLRLKPELLAEYTETMEQSADQPFAQYELEFYHMGDAVVQNFVRVCGPSITSLQLNNCRCTREKLWALLQALSSTLETFAINCDPIEGDGVPGPPLPLLKSLSLCGEFCQSREFLQDLMQASGPGLESLAFRSYDYTLTNSPFENLCFLILCDPAVPTGDRLQNFRMESRLREEQIQSFTQRGCRALKSLNIKLDVSVKSETLVELLSSLEGTLQTLELDFDPDSDCRTTSGESCIKKMKLNNGNGSPGSEEDSPVPKQYYVLPKMAALRRLSMTNFKGSLKFLNGCQSLKYLTLVNSAQAVETLHEVEEHLCVRSFVSTTPVASPACQQLASIFPNLRILDVILDDAALRIVSQNMPNLEELSLSGDKLSDEGITGIENIFEMLTIYGAMEGMTGQLEDQIPELRKLPHIGYLKNLRRIQIHNAGFISDASVIYGIVSCQNLTEISLLNAEVTDISLDIIARKLERLRKLEILCNIPKLTAQGKAEIRAQLPNCDFILGQADIMDLYRPPPRQFNGQVDLLLDLLME